MKYNIKDTLPPLNQKIKVWAVNKNSYSTGNLPHCKLISNDGIDLEWIYDGIHCEYFNYYAGGVWIPDRWEEE